MSALAESIPIDGRIDHTGARVVVVDDVVANVDLLDRLLTKAGLGNVRGFTDPHAALEACAAEPPALVLLDLHMPGLDGVGFIERLREVVGDGGFVPVIVITADVSNDARRTVLEAGANDFLTKPFDVSEVLLRVRNMLTTSRLYTEVRRHADVLQHEVDEQIAREAVTLERRRQQLRRVDDAMAPGGMKIAYQPVVDLSSSTIVGAEALARFSGPPMRPPNLWFDEAGEVGRLADLELHAIGLALNGLGQFPDGGFITINVSPATAITAKFADLLAAYPANRIVVELTEHSRVNDYGALLDALAPFLWGGGRIAVDDAGSGYAGLTHILQLHPHVIKLDAALVTGVDGDPARRALAQSLVSFANDIGATIIAEGIETSAELATLQHLGVHWGQGYYLARPAPLPLVLDAVYQKEAARRLAQGLSPAPGL